MVEALGIGLGGTEPLHELEMRRRVFEAMLCPVGMAGNELQRRPPTLVLAG